MTISIAIPTWEFNGRGSEYLNDLLRTIQIQSYKDFEVCISDHSVGIEVLKEFGNLKANSKLFILKMKVIGVMDLLIQIGQLNYALVILSK